MSVITTGKTFANGEQLSADKLNLMLDNATFSNDAVDLTSTFVDSNGAIVVKDGGITTSKIADTAVTTAKIADSNVTKAKIEDVDDMKVLGNTSGSATAPQEVSVLDEDDMVSDSDTSLDTQQSIKAYVDASASDPFVPSTYAGEESVTLPNGLIMKWGVVEDSPSGNTGVNIVTFGTAFPTAIINVQASWSTTNTSFTNPVYIKGGSVSTTGLTINNLSGTADVYWQAIGY
jgi:hypothetical protein